MRTDTCLITARAEKSYLTPRIWTNKWAGTQNCCIDT